MMALETSYATMVKKGRPGILPQLFELVRDGKSSELNECLNSRPYACSLLTSMWTRASEKEYLSLLMIATLHGHEMVVREILSHSRNIVTMAELEGRMHSVNGDLVNNVTALWCALDRAHFSVAHTLIDVGKANINHGPVHPLLLDAVIRGRLDIVHFLIENGYADVNQTKTNDENRCNSLIVSVIYGHTSIVEYLIKKNAELESKTYVDGNTALAIAAIEGNLELVRILCMAGASSTVRNHADKTPIKLAAENNKLDVVGFFLEHTHDDAVFNDLELAAASHILTYKGTPNFKSEWPLEVLRYLLLKRIQFNIPKRISEPAALYGFQQECQTIDELSHIQKDDDRLYVEALLIQERILFAGKDEKSLTWLFDRAMILIEKGEFDDCLDLVMHIFRLSERDQFQPSLKQYFWIFYNMFKSKVPIPVDRFWKTCDLIFKSFRPNSNDSHIRDISYLLELGAKIDPPDISLILSELNLTYSCVANIYSHGSWIQGTCTPKSDRDLIIVTHSHQEPLTFWEDFDYFHQFELHKLFNKYDVCVYSINNFEKLLEKNYLLCVQCLFLPNQFKLKEEIDFRTTYLNKFYDPKRIKQVALYEIFSSVNMLDPLNRSSSCAIDITEDQKSQSRQDFIFKNLFHGIRFLDLAEQLIETRSIYDLTRVSHVLDTMKDIRGDPTDKSAMKRVLGFVRSKSAEIKSRLDILLPTNIIIGTFKVHITFNCQSNFEETMNKLKNKCQNTKYQIAFIRTNTNQKNDQLQQLIAIRSCYGEYPSIVEPIQKEVHQDFADFDIAGITIKSLASNEGVPKTGIDQKLFWNERICCFEFHYRIPLNQTHVETLLYMVWKKCKRKYGLVLNLPNYMIRRMDHKRFHYMLKMCLFDVGQTKAFERNDKLINELKETFGVQSATEQEFIVYDTNGDSLKIKDS